MSGLGKRTSSNAGTAPQADSTLIGQKALSLLGTSSAVDGRLPEHLRRVPGGRGEEHQPLKDSPDRRVHQQRDDACDHSAATPPSTLARVRGRQKASVAATPAMKENPTTEANTECSRSSSST